MMTTFTDFLSYVTHAYVENFQWRFGQTCFNVLFQADEDLANSIRGTNIDPFHDDSKIPEFLERLRNEWSKDE